MSRLSAAACLAAAVILTGCAEDPPPPPSTPATAPAAPVGGGHVVVDCMIGIDGIVRGCRVVTSEGGPRFTEAVLDWLIGPHAARYRPALRNGLPVPEAHRWDIYFSPP